MSNSVSYTTIPSSCVGSVDDKLLISPADIVGNSIALMNQKDSIDKSNCIF